MSLKAFLLIVCFALTACAGAQTPSMVPSALSGGAGTGDGAETGGRNYLYVASHTPGDASISISRFLLHDGVPEASPDLTIPGYGNLIAVAGNGTLYALGVGSGYRPSVFAFRPGQTQPSRTIALPSLDHCFPTGSGDFAPVAVAADAAGYVFVSLYSYDNVLQPRDSKPCEGVWVYAPTANGQAKPVQIIGFPVPSYLNGLAVDAQDNLYVLQNQVQVVEYSNAVKNPVQSRVFPEMPDRHTQSLAADALGNVFIGRDHGDYTSGRIDRYGPNAKPRQPTSSILLQAPGLHFLYSMATLSKHVFVDDNFANVDVYRAFAHGPQSPMFTLEIANVDSIAAGP
ncbi:MAG: hypothetical protein WB615_01595 [Candidatus Tumulicola sp.]